jgi:hypothetical protein
MLVCPDNLAGKAGKCPHCDAKFRIPLPGASGVGDSVKSTNGGTAATVEAAPAPKAAATETAPAATAPAIRTYDPDHDPAPKADEIVFLCPEGHQLAGPATAAGEAEECPVCHTRFLVPNPEDIEDEEPGVPEINLPQLLAVADTPEGFSLNGDDAGTRGIGQLFAVLWQYKGMNCPIELHLGEGRVLVPNGFAPESAALSHAVFTVTEPNGATTLTVIAWNAIERINVRNLYDIPRGLQIDAP